MTAEVTHIDDSIKRKRIRVSFKNQTNMIMFQHKRMVIGYRKIQQVKLCDSLMGDGSKEVHHRLTVK